MSRNRKTASARGDDFQTLERRAKIIEIIKRQGATSWREVLREVEQWAEQAGAELPKGYDVRYCYKDYERELQALRNFNIKNAEEARLIETARLDALNKKLTELLEKETEVREVGYLVDRLLRVMNRRSKLLGLDHPLLIRFIEDVDFSKLPDDVLERIASGEDPEIVLADYQGRK